MRQLELWLRNPWVIALPVVAIIFVSILYSFGAGLNLEEGRNLALILGGLVALPLAGWRSWLAAKQVALSEAGQNIDRYQKGAQMLGDARLSVRQAGVFGLTELAEHNYDAYQATVMKLLCSFIKDRSLEQKQDLLIKIEKDQVLGREQEQELLRMQKENTWKTMSKRGAALQYGLDNIAPDCQTALNSLSELNMNPQKQVHQFFDGDFNLDGANLTGVELICADLRGSSLRQAILTGASLYAASMSGANLTEADLTEADLTEANLTGADLAGADLTNADLTGTILEDADVFGAHLRRAKGLTARQLETTRNADSDILELLRKVENTEAEKPI